MNEDFQNLKISIDNLEQLVDSTDYDAEEAEMEYYKVESLLEELNKNNWEELDLSGLENRLKTIKESLDLYDSEGELDMMFPNRQDEDFDEDDMSGESFFKD